MPSENPTAPAPAGAPDPVKLDKLADLARGPAPPEIRNRAIILLGRVLTPADRRPCEVLLALANQTAEPDMAFQARRALDEIRRRVAPAKEAAAAPSAPSDALQKLALETNTEVLFPLVDAAVANPRPEFLAVLLKRLRKETDVRVVSKLTKAIGLFGEDSTFEEICRYLEHPDARVRANTIEGLGGMKTEERFKRVMPLLRDPDNRVRANAVRLLRDYKEGDPLQLLGEMLQSPKVAYRSSALFVLSKFRSAQAIELARRALADTEPAVSVQAAEVLVELGQPDGLDPIVKRLDHGSEDESSLALAALKRLQERVTDALKARVDSIVDQYFATRYALPAPAGAVSLSNEDRLMAQIDVLLDDEDGPASSPPLAADVGGPGFTAGTAAEEAETAVFPAAMPLPDLPPPAPAPPPQSVAEPPPPPPPPPRAAEPARREKPARHDKHSDAAFLPARADGAGGAGESAGATRPAGSGESAGAAGGSAKSAGPGSLDVTGAMPLPAPAKPAPRFSKASIQRATQTAVMSTADAKPATGAAAARKKRQMAIAAGTVAALLLLAAGAFFYSRGAKKTSVAPVEVTPVSPPPLPAPSPPPAPPPPAPPSPPAVVKPATPPPKLPSPTPGVSSKPLGAPMPFTSFAQIPGQDAYLLATTHSVSAAGPKTGSVFTPGENIVAIVPGKAAVEQLTTDGTSGAPSPTPDGQRIGFIRGRNGVGDLWLMLSDGKKPRQATTGALCSAVSFSPGGNKAVVNVLNLDESGKTVASNVAVVDLLAKLPVSAKQLFVGQAGKFLSVDGRAASPDWHPKQARIAFCTGPDDIPAKVTILGADGGNKKEFPLPGKARRVRWSPSGKLLAALVEDAGVSKLLYRDLAASGDWKQIAAGADPDKFIVDFDWSPDEDRMVIAAAPQPSGSGRLVLLPLAGSPVSLLTAEAAYREPRFSADAKHVIARDGSAPMATLEDFTLP